jgi:hypothetical protein
VATLISGAELDAWPRYRFNFRDIYDFKEAIAPVTAAHNTASALQRHNASVSSAIPFRLSPGGVNSDCVDAWTPKPKLILEPFQRAHLYNLLIFATGLSSQHFA